jgi:hypothetical protein
MSGISGHDFSDLIFFRFLETMRAKTGNGHFVHDKNTIKVEKTLKSF